MNKTCTIKSILESCWDTNPTKRPSMDDVIEKRIFFPMKIHFIKIVFYLFRYISLKKQNSREKKVKKHKKAPKEEKSKDKKKRKRKEK